MSILASPHPVSVKRASVSCLGVNWKSREREPYLCSIEDTSACTKLNSISIRFYTLHCSLLSIVHAIGGRHVRSVPKVGDTITDSILLKIDTGMYNSTQQSRKAEATKYPQCSTIPQSPADIVISRQAILICLLGISNFLCTLLDIFLLGKRRL